MKSCRTSRRLGGLLMGACLASAHAYPPAPYHTLHGIVRDEYGVPVGGGGTLLILTAGSMRITTQVTPTVSAAGNYRLPISMDSEAAADLYKATALRPFFPFQIRVEIGGVNHVPIEMNAATWQMGQPAGSTRLDLTLGVDADDDGLPDIWQAQLARLLPGAGTGPNDDADGDGVSNRDEFFAGTFAFQPADGFRLELHAPGSEPPYLEFLVASGRDYRVDSSDDLKEWSPVSFRVPGLEGVVQAYTAVETRPLQVQPVLPSGALPGGRFYRVVRSP